MPSFIIVYPYILSSELSTNWGTAEWGQKLEPKELPGKLREIRKRLNLSQEEMAQHFKTIPGDMYSGLISRYEHGKAEPSLLVLLEYARLSGVSMDTLVDDKLSLPKS